MKSSAPDSVFVAWCLRCDLPVATGKTEAIVSGALCPACPPHHQRFAHVRLSAYARVEGTFRTGLRTFEVLVTRLAFLARLDRETVWRWLSRDRGGATTPMPKVEARILRAIGDDDRIAHGIEREGKEGPW